jgi:hypothetical protein
MYFVVLCLLSFASKCTRVMSVCHDMLYICKRSPVEDGVEVFGEPRKLMAQGQFATNVSVLLGTNADEGSLFNSGGYNSNEEDYINYANKVWFFFCCLKDVEEAKVERGLIFSSYISLCVSLYSFQYLGEEFGALVLAEYPFADYNGTQVFIYHTCSFLNLCPIIYV